MKFMFSISRAGSIQSAGVHYVEGSVESGTVNRGDVAVVEGCPERRVEIHSVALVDAEAEDLNTLTLSIAPPTFPLEELIGARLIGQ